MTDFLDMLRHGAFTRAVLADRELDGNPCTEEVAALRVAQERADKLYDALSCLLSAFPELMAGYSTHAQQIALRAAYEALEGGR